MSARLRLVQDGEEPAPRIGCMCGSKVPAVHGRQGQLLVTHCLKCCSPEGRPSEAKRRPVLRIGVLEPTLGAYVVVLAVAVAIAAALIVWKQ